jgi:hypothetical protein
MSINHKYFMNGERAKNDLCEVLLEALFWRSEDYTGMQRGQARFITYY